MSLNTVIQALGALLYLRIVLKTRLFFLHFTALKWLRFADKGSIFLSSSLIGSWSFSGELLTSSLGLFKLTAIRLSLFYERNTKWIPLFEYWDPNTLDVARLLKSQKHSPSRWCFFFLHFSQVSQHPACLDHSIQIRESIWYFLSGYQNLKISLMFYNDRFSSIDNTERPLVWEAICPSKSINRHRWCLVVVPNVGTLNHVFIFSILFLCYSRRTLHRQCWTTPKKLKWSGNCRNVGRGILTYQAKASSRFSSTKELCSKHHDFFPKVSAVLWPFWLATF